MYTFCSHEQCSKVSRIFLQLVQSITYKEDLYFVDCKIFVVDSTVLDNMFCLCIFYQCLIECYALRPKPHLHVAL